MTLLKKDELNSYGIMAPSGAGGERRIRGAGLYVQSSLVNHEVGSLHLPSASVNSLAVSVFSWMTHTVSVVFCPHMFIVV